MALAFYEITNPSFHCWIFRICFIIREKKVRLCKADTKLKNYGINPEQSSLGFVVIWEVEPLYTQELVMLGEGGGGDGDRIAAIFSEGCGL